MKLIIKYFRGLVVLIVDMQQTSVWWMEFNSVFQMQLLRVNQWTVTDEKDIEALINSF